MIDIYYEKDYANLYSGMEQGQEEYFIFTHKYGKILHLFIKREIPVELNGRKWFDIITPYGYGGPVIEECLEGKEEILVDEFYKEFSRYCADNGIVSEFIRFHPVLDFARFFSKYYKVEFQRETVGTSITDEKDPFMEEFSKSARKTVKSAFKAGLNYRISLNPSNIDSFKAVYYSTMDRNEASEYYYFNDQYFDKCLQKLGDRVLFIEVYNEANVVVAAAFYFVYSNTIHAHLSGTLNEYIHLSPAYIIKYATIEWAKNNKINLIHYGGGTTNNPEDTLLKFKKKFTKNTFFRFYTGKKIWNQGIYNKLCEINHSDTEIEFFPAYRS